MDASFYFDAKQVDQMPVTITFTATLGEWKKLKEAVHTDEHSDLRSLEHCIKNIVDAIEIATGAGPYRTRSYSYKAATRDEPAS